MIAQRSVAIDDVDLSDTRFRGRRDVSEGVEGLAESLKKNGLHNPVKLWVLDGRLIVLGGWRRIHAAKRLGWKTIPALVYDDIDIGKATEINIVDNANRVNLSVLEEADRALFLRKDRGFAVPEIENLFGCGSNHVYELLRVAEMSPEVRDIIGRGGLSLSAAVALDKFPAEVRSMYTLRAVSERWGVRRIEEERSALEKPSRVSDLDITPDRRFDAVRFDFTPINTWRLQSYHEDFGKHLGDPGPYRCQFSSTIIAREMTPPYVCPNFIEWAVLAPGDYYYGHAGYAEGEIVPMEERGVWMLACTDCVKWVFLNVVFHPEIPFIFPADRRAQAGVVGPS